MTQNGTMTWQMLSQTSVSAARRVQLMNTRAGLGAWRRGQWASHAGGLRIYVRLACAAGTTAVTRPQHSRVVTGLVSLALAVRFARNIRVSVSALTLVQLSPVILACLFPRL